jgi:hypothetical protein
MNDIEKYENMIADLERKREACVQRGTGLSDERASVALDAHIGDSKAAKRLVDIHNALALHSSELASLDAAAKAAGERLAAAQAVKAQEANRQRVEELRKHVDELSQVPAYIEKHLTAALRGLIAIERGVAELHQLGVAFPTDIQLRLGMTAVLGTWLQQLPKLWWNEIAAGLRFRAPNERKSALSYWNQIEPSLRNIIAQAVDAPVSKAPAMQKPDARDRHERVVAMGEFLSGGV